MYGLPTHLTPATASCWMCLAPWTPIIAGDNSRHYDNCVYYSGRPGNNPAPPEIVAALNPNRGSQNASTTPIRGPILPPTLPLTVNRIEQPEEELGEFDRALRRLRLIAEERNQRRAIRQNTGLENGALRPPYLLEPPVSDDEDENEGEWEEDEEDEDEDEDEDEENEENEEENEDEEDEDEDEDEVEDEVEVEEEVEDDEENDEDEDEDDEDDDYDDYDEDDDGGH